MTVTKWLKHRYKHLIPPWSLHGRWNVELECSAWEVQGILRIWTIRFLPGDHCSLTQPWFDRTLRFFSSIFQPSQAVTIRWGDVESDVELTDWTAIILSAKQIINVWSSNSRHSTFVKGIQFWHSWHYSPSHSFCGAAFSCEDYILLLLGSRRCLYC